MAIHQNIASMLQESLPEMILVAKYCIEYHKDSNIWPAQGCYGYPAALLLLSITDSIGSYVKKGNIENHFEILNDSDYYGLSLTKEEIHLIYNHYRNTLSHNAAIAPKVILNTGTTSDPVLQKLEDNRYEFKLVPFYVNSVKAVKHFLGEPKILIGNQTMLDIYKK